MRIKLLSLFFHVLMKSMKLTSNYYSLLSFTQYGQRRRGYGAQQPDVPVRINQRPELHVSRIHDEKRRFYMTTNDARTYRTVPMRRFSPAKCPTMIRTCSSSAWLCARLTDFLLPTSLSPLLRPSPLVLYSIRLFWDFFCLLSFGMTTKDFTLKS